MSEIGLGELVVLASASLSEVRTVSERGVRLTVSEAVVSMPVMMNVGGAGRRRGMVALAGTPAATGKRGRRMGRVRLTLAAETETQEEVRG